MNLPTRPDLAAIALRVQITLHAHWKLFLINGVLMVVLGTLAIAVPTFSTLEIEILLGWLFVVGGAFRTVSIVRKRHLPGFWWSLLSGVLALVLGATLLARPLQGILTLTVILAAFFVIEGVASIFVAFDFRRHLKSWVWMLFSGLIDLVLTYLIWRGWPTTATWIIGLLAGINMIFIGIPLIVTALAARTAATAPPPSAAHAGTAA